MWRVALALVSALVLTASAGAQAPACAPTAPDMLGPFYKANAPERAVTGQGLVVSGTVRSVKGCAPLPGARLEWWSADSRGEYQDELRATQKVGADGAFRYETVAPGRYPGRPPHLHVKVSAPGHRTLVTQVYPRDGQRSIATDFVLVAE
ncbi:MAG TPA: intradiol ring-cleavage dioxygenase [Methylomirabilota bacterium]|jgi:protocatechuate 3,4-dioxygenase beta subunit|nr:intradiol ring-cleavage dioxygenase [Methylomirabilota bacterium]